MADKPPMCPGTWLLGNATSLLDDTAGTLTVHFHPQLRPEDRTLVQLEGWILGLA